MLSYQLRKRGRDLDIGDARKTAHLLLEALAPRLAAVAADCSDEQLARALWAYGVIRRPHPDVIQAACRELPQRLGAMPLPHLATAAWGLAAAARRQSEELRGPVRDLLQLIARHLVDTRPDSLTLPPPASGLQPASAAADAAGASPAPAPARMPLAAVSSHAAAAGPLQPAADEVAAVAGRSAEEAERPWLDHRSALKLAWAFAAVEVRDSQALDLIGDAAAARIASQLRAHNAASGPLSPRATYLYRTIRGWQAWPRPRPPRVGTSGRRSRYLYDERPRVVLRDFTLGSLAPLLAAFRRLEHAHEGLLQASAQHVRASAGPSTRIRPADLARTLAAFRAARFTDPAALDALLRCTQLQELPAPRLLRLATLAALWGVRRRSLYDRMLHQLAARAWVQGEAPPADGAGALQAEGSGPAGAAAGEGSGAVRLDPRVAEAARAAPASWRAAEQSLAGEAAEFTEAAWRAEDECQPRDVANCLWALARIGVDKERARPYVVPLFGALLGRLHDRRLLPPDSLARLAAASLHFGLARFKDQRSEDILTDLTRLALYGERVVTTRGSQSRQVRLHAAAASGNPADAAALREEVGLSARGAAVLAEAVTRLPEERPRAVASNDDMRALLALLDPETTRVALLQRIRHVLSSRGREAALPRSLGEGVLEGPGV